MNAVVERVVRPMGVADLDAVLACEANGQPFPWTIGHFKDCIESGYSCWVSTEAECVTAFGIVLLVVDEAHLLNIGVAAAYRRQGRGHQMLEQLYERARSAGATQMFLEVRPSNLPALALYSKEGFVEIGRRKGYYPAAEGRREDAWVLRRPL